LVIGYRGRLHKYKPGPPYSTPLLLEEGLLLAAMIG